MQFNKESGKEQQQSLNFTDAMIEQDNMSLQLLETKVQTLRSEVIDLEQKISQLPPSSTMLPEDLEHVHKSTQQSSRIQGLIKRILQTHTLSMDISNLKS